MPATIDGVVGLPDVGRRQGSPLTALGPLERRVMEALWQRGTSTPREVLERLNEDADRPLAYTTSMTILVRLHEKGFADRHRVGRHYAYVAKVGRDDVEAVAGRRELERLVDRYGAQAVARFAEELLPADKELRQRLSELATRENGDQA